jgi:nitroimidazol reductase NimA-like FMN-containing flavoprotein (pyridoxamine 5'-phosphate oxidase superfamily)
MDYIRGEVSRARRQRADHGPRRGYTFHMPVPVTGPYSEDEVERYLRETVVPVRLACLTASGWPLVLSLWFLYRDGTLWCASRPGARVVEHLERDARCAFEVAREAPPYRGVRGQARATVLGAAGGRLLGELIDRYLSARTSPLARRLLAGAADEVAIRIVPTRLTSWDYTARMGAG